MILFALFALYYLFVRRFSAPSMDSAGSTQMLWSDGLGPFVHQPDEVDLSFRNNLGS
jgi:hypothetical protein